MKIGKINQLTESNGFTLYTGVAPVKVLAVNPDKKKLSELYGREVKDEPVYLSETEVIVVGNKQKVAQVRLDFIIKQEDVNITTKMSFFLANAYVSNKEGTKYKIIDNFGNTAWATVDEVKAKTIPTYSDGPAKIDADYHLARQGEEELISFIKNFLGIKNLFVFNSNEKIEDPSEAFCALEHIDSLLKGDVKEITNIIGLAPNNYVKVLFGVRSSDSGNFQSVYERFTAKNSMGKSGDTYTKFKEVIEERKSRGSLSSFTFTFGDIQKYEPQTTKFENPNAGVSNISSAPTVNTLDDDIPF